MARPLRIEFAGALYHVTSRGNARQPIFLTDNDRQEWLLLLAKVLARYHWRCHAYCLMDNHYHLLVETLEPTLAVGMRQLNGVYTQQFNRRHGRVGHVFQGRYKAIVVEKDAYLLELCRYVVLNPVRARLVKDPGQWAWSSYRATAGHAAKPSWLTTDWVWAQFGRQRSAAQRRYRSFVLDGRQRASPWEQLRGQIYLGSESFCERLARNESLGEISRQQRQPVRPTLRHVFTSGGSRRQQLLQAYRDYGYRMREIADHLGVHYATVSRWLREGEERLSNAST